MERGTVPDVTRICIWLPANCISNPPMLFCTEDAPAELSAMNKAFPPEVLSRNANKPPEAPTPRLYQVLTTAQDTTLSVEYFCAVMVPVVEMLKLVLTELESGISDHLLFGNTSAELPMLMYCTLLPTNRPPLDIDRKYFVSSAESLANRQLVKFKNVADSA